MTFWPSNSRSKTQLAISQYFVREGRLYCGKGQSAKTEVLAKLISKEIGEPVPAKNDLRSFFERFLLLHPDIRPWKTGELKREAKGLLPSYVIQDAKKKGKRRAHLGPHEFYESREWLEVRYFALKAANGACQCCGATAASSGKPLHVDHIKPRSKFPELELDRTNLQVLCRDCNMGKSNKDDTDWRGHGATVVDIAILRRNREQGL